MGNEIVEVTLTPISMIVPNEAGIYAPSRIRKQIKITQDKATKLFKIPCQVMVSFEPDGISNPQEVEAIFSGTYWIVNNDAT